MSDAEILLRDLKENSILHLTLNAAGHRSGISDAQNGSSTFIAKPAPQWQDA